MEISSLSRNVWNAIGRLVSKVGINSKFTETWDFCKLDKGVIEIYKKPISASHDIVENTEAFNINLRLFLHN